MKRGWIAIAALALACPATAIAANTQTDVAARFVTMVKAGQDLAGSEFAAVLSAADAAKLKQLTACEPRPPRGSDTGSSSLIMWDCPGQASNQGVGTMLSFSDGKVSSIFVMGAVMVTTGSR